MGSKWRKAKLALGLNLCLYVPRGGVVDDEGIDDSLFPPPPPPRFSVSAGDGGGAAAAVGAPSTLVASSSGLRSATSSNKITCAICLTAMKPGHGHAIFTAECSHSFHFHCIASNVKYGNQICPICRAKWKEVPFQGPASDISNGRRPRINTVGWAREDGWMTVLRRLPPAQQTTDRNGPHDINRRNSLFNHAREPAIFDDDEALDEQRDVADRNVSDSIDADDTEAVGTIEVKTYPEVSAVPRSNSHDNFTVLIHFKAPLTRQCQTNNRSQSEFPDIQQNSRAPVDLVTVLDISGSMAGTKLALLKRAMGFVAQNLGPSDRLSVIAFSSTARRLFPLRRMTEAGKQEALQAVNALVSNGGTNIAEGLRKGSRVIVDRRWKNPVSSIILLSDGQDTYTINSPNANRGSTGYRLLLPLSSQRNSGMGFQIPVHAFGFGADHDAASMHSISEISGGTFSFIEAEGVIQDAFAQCIGGLLSVVVQELQVRVKCLHPQVKVSSIKAGSYRTSIMENGTVGSINVGDLYAQEERDFLVNINIPVGKSVSDMPLLKVGCTYKDPVTKRIVSLKEASQVKIQRPEKVGKQVVSLEVDRQRNRIKAAEAMAEARRAAENGNLAQAVSILENCHKTLSETPSAKAREKLCIALSAELKEMQERMANHQIYESSGRAYMLSGLSSHSLQRATARGDSMESTSLLQAYQTPSMVDMVTRSQTMLLGSSSSQEQRRLWKALSFPAARLQPR